jgi:hypothetical protein
MFHALYTAATGMTAQEINLDNIANNLANSSTSGFQARRVQFSDLLYQTEVMPGAAATQQTSVAAGLQIGLGTLPGNTEITQTQGDLSSTGQSRSTLRSRVPGSSRFFCPTTRLATRAPVVSDRFAGKPCDGKWECAAAGNCHPAQCDQHHGGQ